MSFSNIIFTSDGYTLQAKAQTGVPIILTKIAMGDGSLTGQAIQELKNLISHKKDIPLTKFQIGTDGTATVGGVLNNQDMTQGFYWREFGLFAKDPTDDLKEILYCYGNAGELAEYIPAGGESQILEKRIQLTTLIGNAEQVSAELSNSTIYVTQADFETELIALRQEIQNIDLSSVVSEVNNNTNAQINSQTVHLSDQLNQRINTDMTKALNQLISEWITGAKDSVLNAITTLTSHVTNKATEIKSHMTTKATEVKDYVTTEMSGVESHVTSQHTATKSHVSTERATTVNAVNAARDNIKSHVSTQMSGLTKVYRDSNTTRITVVGGSQQSSLLSTTDAYKVLYKFSAKYDGVMRLYLDYYNRRAAAPFYIIIVDPSRKYTDFLTSTPSSGKHYSYFSDKFKALCQSPVGTIISETISGWGTYMGYRHFEARSVLGLTCNESEGKWSNISDCFNVEKGKEYVVAVYSNYPKSSTEYESYFRNIRICYDEEVI